MSKKKVNYCFLTEFQLTEPFSASIHRIIELSKIINTATGDPVFIASLMMDNAIPKVKEFNKIFSIYFIGENNKCEKKHFKKKYFLHKEKFKELKSIINYFEKVNAKPVFIIYNYFSSFYDLLIFTKFLKEKGFKVIIEKNERALASAKIHSYPHGIHKRIIFSLFQLIEIINGFFIDRNFKIFDGFLTINENYKYFISRKVPRTPILKIPVLYEEFNINMRENKTDNNLLSIGYFGTINFKRDKIGLVLKALYLLKENYNINNIVFTIGGKASKHEEARLKNMIKLFDLGQTVNYVGYLGNEDLNIQLKKQNILLSLRNNNMQGKYSFATKIAMYMHMGKIPLVSNVSDNSLYITNGVNGFILSCTDSNSLTKQLYDITKMEEKTLNDISIEAKRTAQKYFYYKSYVNDLKIFLNEI